MNSNERLIEPLECAVDGCSAQQQIISRTSFAQSGSSRDRGPERSAIVTLAQLSDLPLPG